MPSLVSAIATQSLAATLRLTGQGGAPVPHQGPTRDEVMAMVAHMRATPVTLERPVLILNGYHTPPHVAWWLCHALQQLLTTDRRSLAWVSYASACSLQSAAGAVARFVHQQRVPRGWRVDQPVDVIGISMGGLVARLIAAEGSAPVRIERLLTLATPHQGSIRARLIAPDRAAADMKPGSAFLARLNASQLPPQLVCYAQQGDRVVDPVHASPPGVGVIVGGPSRFMSHFTTGHNPWLLADLARRLRNEPPLFQPALVADTHSRGRST